MSLKPCSIGVPGWADVFVAQSVGARKMTAMKESRPDFVFVICIVSVHLDAEVVHRKIFFHATPGTHWPSCIHLEHTILALAAKRCHAGVRDLSFLNRRTERRVSDRELTSH